LTIIASILSGNTAYTPHGAPFAGVAYGGGIYNAGTLTLMNSLLGGNSAQGGAGFQLSPPPNGGAFGGGVYITAAP
jgi:hypothetical protein